jgi:hypothetical protein
VPHPTLKRPNGRAHQRAERSCRIRTIPAYRFRTAVDELMLLGDGDSEPVLTQVRHDAGSSGATARPGRVIRIAFAPAGVDFNDVLRGAA